MYGTRFTRTNTVSVVLQKKERGHRGRIHTTNNMRQSHKDLLHLVSTLLKHPAFIISTPYNSLLFLMGVFYVGEKMLPVENECRSLLEGLVLSLVNLLCVTQSNPAVSNSSRFSLLSAGRLLSAAPWTGFGF